MDQPNKEEQREEELTFKFRFKSEIEPFLVVYKTSMTVLDALNTNKSFTKNNESSQKEIVIQRLNKAALNTDFPCCLLEKDEILTLTFIKSLIKDFTGQQTHKVLSHHRRDLVTFNIKTTGGKGVMYIMKNIELKNTVEYVCVHALKGEEVKTALKRDGRFIDKILHEEDYDLIECNEIGKQTKYKMSNPVEHFDKKTFQIIVNCYSSPASKLKKQTDVKNESDVASNTSDSAKNDPDQNPISNEQKQILHNKEYTKWLVIPDSQEIMQILRDQHKGLLKTLKERKELKDSQVQKFFRAEYDKSVQSFSEVKKVKQLMRLSDSVCQIRVEGSARGTGFLLFDRFVLTNAHVIGEFDPFTRKLSKTFTAAFGYEDLEVKETKCALVKEHIAAYYHGKINKDRHLDFALLELNDVDEITCRPGLLSRYIHAPPPNRGGICIVGHPDGGIKRMDPCFITENLQEAADEHISKNVEFIQVMTQRSFEDKWAVYENQITYDSCFFHGSSGSPVFDEDCYLIGVHTGGYVYPGERGKTRSIMEYAYSMQPILEYIITQVKESKRSDILTLLSEYKSLNLNLKDNVVDMEKDPQNQEMNNGTVQS